jgi:predicted DNA-binding protein with PD1-like motif
MLKEYYGKAEIPGGREQAVPQDIHMHEVRGKDEGRPYQGKVREGQVQEVQVQAIEGDTQGA